MAVWTLISRTLVACMQVNQPHGPGDSPRGQGVCKGSMPELLLSVKHMQHFSPKSYLALDLNTDNKPSARQQTAILSFVFLVIASPAGRSMHCMLTGKLPCLCLLQFLDKPAALGI